MFLLVRRLLPALALATVPVAEAQDTHVNETAGYRVRPPRHFVVTGQPVLATSLPDLGAALPGVGAGSRYEVDRLRCERKLVGRDHRTFHREMTVYLFPAEGPRQPGDRGAANSLDGLISKKVSQALGKSSSYSSFEDFAAENFDGFLIDRREDGKVADCASTILELAGAKSAAAPERWIACVYDAPAGQFAVLFTCTEQHFRKFRAEHVKTFRSFRVLPREEPAPAVAPEGEPAPPAVPQDALPETGADAGAAPELDAAPTEEVADPAVLLADRERQIARAVAELPAGWDHLRSDDCVVLFASDRALAERVASHVAALRAWFSATFPSFGVGVVVPAIIRVHAPGTRILEPTVLTIGPLQTGRQDEIVLATTPDGSPDVGKLNLDLMEDWFVQRSAPAWRNLPPWLREGLVEVVADATLRRNRLTFPLDDRERDGLLALLKPGSAAGEAGPLEQILAAPADGAWSGAAGKRARAQAASFLRFLVEGPGRTGRRTAYVLQHTIDHLQDRLAAAGPPADVDRVPLQAGAQVQGNELTGRDLEQLLGEALDRYAEQSSAASQAQHDLWRETCERTFGDWQESDWRELERAWRAFALASARQRS